MEKKIVKGFVTVIAALIIAEAFFIVAFFSITEKYRQITDNLISEYELSQNSTALVNSFYDLIQYSNDQERVKTLKNTQDKLQGLLAKLDVRLAGTDSWTAYLGTKNTINVVINDVKSGIDDNLAGNYSQVTEDYLTIVKYNNFVKDNISGLLLKELGGMEAAQADLENIKFWSALCGIILFAIVVAGSIVYAILFSKKIAAPLQRLGEFAKNINGGNFEKKLDDGFKEENNDLAPLAESLEAISRTLKNDIKKIKDKSTDLDLLKKNIVGLIPPDAAPAETAAKPTIIK